MWDSHLDSVLILRNRCISRGFCEPRHKRRQSTHLWIHECRKGCEVLQSELPGKGLGSEFCENRGSSHCGMGRSAKAYWKTRGSSRMLRLYPIKGGTHSTSFFCKCEMCKSLNYSLPQIISHIYGKVPESV